MRKVISIVTPCYNEEEGIAECYETIKRVFETELPEYNREHIFCDNASSDRTVDILREIAAKDASVKIIVNSRNFGPLRSNYNGVMSASGDAIVLFMPADLQDPPELIPEFVHLWEQGYEIVYGLRASRAEGLVMRSTRKFYYRMLSRFSYVDYPPDAGDFQLVDKKVLAALKQFDDASPFMRMMTFETGFRSVGVPYRWRARAHGLSRNSLNHLVDQGLTGVVSFSTAPLRIALFLGTLIALLSLVLAFVTVALRIVGIDSGARGTTTVVSAIFFLGGVQLAFLGLLGEYTMTILTQVRSRPLVVERERVNFDRD